MSQETKQVGVRVNKSLWEEFRQDVAERKGGVKGHLRAEFETALREYINASEGGDTHDRLTHIERKLDDLHTAVREGDEKKKDSGVSQTTEQRVDDIVNQIDEETGNSPKVHEEVVELAIRENAGSSPPTIRRYKELLRQDEHLFKHPTNDRRYFTDSEDYVKATNALRKAGKLRAKPYSNIVEQYGEEWWLAQQEQEVSDQPKGFQ